MLSRTIEQSTDPQEKDLQLEQELRMNFSQRIEKPPSIVSINASEVEGRLAPICTIGDISMLIGKAKSRKSFFLSSIVASYLQGYCSLTNIHGNPGNEAKALFFDTEMSPYYSQRMGFSVLSQLKDEADHSRYIHYQMRKINPSEKAEFVENRLKEYTGQVGLVVIDGIRDLLRTGINDEEEATYISTLLLRWTYEYKVHIMTVLHQNKNDNHARGHVGSELTHKCATVISIEKDLKETTNSIVKPEYTRDMEFETFSFALDEEFCPYLVEASPPVNKKEIKMREDFLFIFKDRQSMGYSELVKNYKEASGLSEATAKRDVAKGMKIEIVKKMNQLYYLNPEQKEQDDNIPF